VGQEVRVNVHCAVEFTTEHSSKEHGLLSLHITELLVQVPLARSHKNGLQAFVVLHSIGVKVHTP